MPGLRMHLTEDRVREIIRFTLIIVDDWGSAPQNADPDYPIFEEQCLAFTLPSARGIPYPAVVRGAMGGRAKEAAHPGPGKRTNEAIARRRKARLAKKPEEESCIGSVRITR